MDIGSILEISDYEILNDVQELLIEESSMSKPEVVAVEIVDHNFNVIAFGNENDNKIEKLVNRSDLITEITGKKFFRLCYETE
jgi:hypothetical protein